MQKITTFLWFEDQAEEAVNFYTSVFRNSKVLKISRFGEGTPAPSETAMSIRFMLNGHEFMAVNSGVNLPFSSSISFVLNCDSQSEIDELWSKLCDGGEEHACGWVKDKFGMSWQIVPSIVHEMLTDPDHLKSQRTMAALSRMKKVDIKTLELGYQKVLA